MFLFSKWSYSTPTVILNAILLMSITFLFSLPLLFSGIVLSKTVQTHQSQQTKMLAAKSRTLTFSCSKLGPGSVISETKIHVCPRLGLSQGQASQESRQRSAGTTDWSPPGLSFRRMTQMVFLQTENDSGFMKLLKKSQNKFTVEMR